MSDLAAAGEGVVVAFIDVILVVEHVVECRGFRRDWSYIPLVGFAIRAPSHAPTNHRSAHGKEHQSVFDWSGVFLFFFAGGELSALAFLLEDGCLADEHRFQKLRKTVGAAETVRPS